LLKAAAKASSKKKDGLDYAGELPGSAELLRALRQRDELEREIDLLRESVRRTLEPWYREQLVSRGYETTVRAAGLRLSFQHRYAKLPADREEPLRGIVNGSFERFFKPVSSLRVRKEIAEDPERLDAVVLDLANTLGAERFAEVFECEQTLTPTRVFTERRYLDLTPEQNAALELAGVRQIVSFAEGR
jgi:hypothetical protein